MVEGDECSLTVASQTQYRGGSATGHHSMVSYQNLSMASLDESTEVVGPPKKGAPHKTDLKTKADIVTEEEEKESEDAGSQMHKAESADEMATLPFEDEDLASNHSGNSETSVRRMEGSFTNKLEVSTKSRQASHSQHRKRTRFNASKD